MVHRIRASRTKILQARRLLREGGDARVQARRCVCCVHITLPFDLGTTGRSAAYALDKSRALYAQAAHGPEYA